MQMSSNYFVAQWVLGFMLQFWFVEWEQENISVSKSKCKMSPSAECIGNVSITQYTLPFLMGMSTDWWKEN